MLEASTWSDLVNAIQAVDAGARSGLVGMIKANRTKEAGDFLYKALEANAQLRAESIVDAMLVDDTLSLAEIDGLL